MSKALDRGQRSGSDPIIIGDSNNKILISKGSDNLVKFQTQASGQSAVNSSAGATKVYANISAMTATSPTTGDQAFVTANSGLYIYNGGGWYKIATVNTSPTISSPSTGANITLATDGAATSIELVGSDVDEGTTLQNSYAVTTGSLTNGGGATATITSSATSNGTYSALAPSTNTTNRFFKITPTTNTSYIGTFSLTFSMSDGISAATTVQNFTLIFSVPGGINFATADSTTLASHSGFDFGTNDFTIEFFYKWSTNSGYQTLINHQYNLADGVALQSNTGTYKWGLFGSNISLQYETSDANVNTWYHYAIVRNGNTIKIYRDGTETYTKSHSVSVGGTDTTIFGIVSGGTHPDKGKLSNFRVIKGTALYTSAGFTPPSANLTAVSGTSLLLFQENTSTVYTNGSTLYADQNTYIDTPSSSDFTLGTGDFTVEGWFNWANSPGYNIFDFGSNGYQLRFNGASALGFWTANGGYITGSVSISTNTWYHVAWTRASGTGYCYLNGTQIASGTPNKDVTTTTLRMNGYGGAAGYGQVGVKHSDVRVVKGKAVYTGNFSTPTGPLTKTGGTYPNSTNRTDPTASETVLLTHQDTSGTTVPTDNSDSNHTLTKSGTITKGAGYNVATLSDGSSNNVTVTKGANHLVLTSDGPFA